MEKIFILMCIAVILPNTILASFPITISELEQQIAQIQNLEDPNIFFVAVHKQQNELYEKLKLHFTDVCREHLISSGLKEIIPFLDSDNPAVHALATEALREVMADKTLRIYERKNLLSELIDYLATCPELAGWDVFLLQIASENELMDGNSHLKQVIFDWVVKRQGNPLLLEIYPDLYASLVIHEYLEKRSHQVKFITMKYFAQVRGKGAGDPLFNIFALLLLARNGSDAAFEQYNTLAIEAIKQNVYPERILRGYALIATKKAYDVLFQMQCDFNRSSFSGNPIALIATGILYYTINEYPFLDINSWTPIDFSESTLEPYLEWNREHQDAYQIKKLSPYQLYRFISQ